ncbi:hypothetical protein [Oscillatoria sp. HE19RPO]|uniref:hypothetical protein n=1 Tax=Oscillatoria sp. HE19RPO TaxID=2954806 RepID=UPI0020C508BE|nr:hypothetical protein [Oscillatoria sp. HE19RPO]
MFVVTTSVVTACHGDRHDRHPCGLKRLFGDWMVCLQWGVTWLLPSHAVTTEVVTTNIEPIGPKPDLQNTNNQHKTTQI